MRFKSATLIIGYILLNMVSSCYNCHDGKYVDYAAIELNPSETRISSADSLVFQIKMKDLSFTAYNENFAGLITSAYAIDCDYGWGGEKYAISDFKVSSDADFDETHSAGSSLNDLVTVLASLDIHTEARQKLNDADLNAYSNAWGRMYIKQRPTVSKTHHLTISFQKSNSTAMSATSDAITWE